MRIEIDTINKTIKLLDAVSLKELFYKLRQILPNGEWKQFTLDTNTIVNHLSFPTVIEKYPKISYPSTPPWYCCSTEDGSYHLKSGKYQADIE